MSARDAHPGRCTLHDGWADDVELIQAQDHGSGFGGGGTHSCLRCLAPLAEQPHASKRMQAALASLEERAIEQERAA